MRAGWVVSLIGHVGFVLMTLLAWETRSTLTPEIGSVVPVEIVDVAAESNVRALAEDLPDEEVSPEEQQTAEAAPEPAPAPAPAERRQQQNDEFDLAAIAGLIDRQRDPGRRRTEGQRADRTQQGAGLGTAEVASLVDLNRTVMRRHLLRCWRMPIDLPEPERLVVTVEFELDRNGNIRGQPRVTNPRNYTFDAPMRTAVDAAVRAVRMCEPYPFPDDQRLSEHYDVWDEQEFTFRPQVN